MRSRRFRLLRMRMRERINSFICACAQALVRLFRAQKRTERAGFEPSTLSMPRTPMRYDALDRSTTTAGFGCKILSEIGTCGSSHFGVVPILDVPYSDVHCTVNVWNPNVFGFWTVPFCSVSKLSEIWTNLFGFQTVLSVRNPNVAVRTFGFRTIDLTLYYKTLKSERLNEANEPNIRNPNINEPNPKTFGFRMLTVVPFPNIRISDVFTKLVHFTVNVRNPNTFGFQTPPHRSVQNCFEQTKMSELRTFCSDFRHKFVSEIGTHDRSNVRFSDVSTRLDRFIY